MFKSCGICPLGAFTCDMWNADDFILLWGGLLASMKGTLCNAASMRVRTVLA